MLKSFRSSLQSHPLWVTLYILRPFIIFFSFLASKECCWKPNRREERSGGEVKPVHHEIVDRTEPVINDGLPPGIHKVCKGLNGVHRGMPNLHSGPANGVGRFNSHTAGSWDRVIKHSCYRFVQHAHETTAGCRHAVAETRKLWWACIWACTAWFAYFIYRLPKCISSLSVVTNI